MRKESVIDCSCGCGLKPTKSALWFLESLDRQFTAATGKELYVTSGARCFKHNADVGGVPNSAHVKGLAFDVHFDNSSECYIIVQHLFKMGITRIGINFAKSFVHFDIDSTKPQGVLFKY